nr:MAG TPA: hypothetical protein [Caudoviricetes sp.]
MTTISRCDTIYHRRGSGTKPTGGTRVHELGWLLALSLNSKEGVSIWNGFRQ